MMGTAHKVEVAVIGAGVIGLACARNLALRGKEVLILESAGRIGTGTSSRNSEVVHAGIYYPKNSLKAKLCIEGKRLLYEYCQARSIPHQQIGKIIVATKNEQLKFDLPAIQCRAEENGVQDLRLLSATDIRLVEPELDCVGGLFSPSSGIIDSHAYMLSLLADAENNGATLALNSTVQGAEIVSQEGIILDVDEMKLSCGLLINCAGLYAHQICQYLIQNEPFPPSSRYHCSVTRTNSRQFFAKGNYFKLIGQKCPFSHLIYPVPEPGGLGVHATIDLSGGCRFGPNVEWIPFEVEYPSDISMSVSNQSLSLFYKKIRNYWPNIKKESLFADYCGVRPKLSHPDLTCGALLDADFVIEGPMCHGIDGFINLLGIESPGLTSSLAIADHVANIAIHQMDMKEEIQNLQ
mmetsp:Transcript_6106/g.8915  ORF Transcript_6106/g.8915 Transcript_6106/m.8915 type:complete len:408 (-) Transcript_6106:758-1981(-)